MTEPVRAAGGVVWREEEAGGLELLLVHRGRYDDWTFPKGKLDPGETWEQAAVREVFEEVGVVAVLGPELATSTYTDHKGRPKTVRYWTMTVATDVGFEADDEVSERRWLSLAEVADWLTYPRDRPILTSFTDWYAATHA